MAKQWTLEELKEARAALQELEGAKHDPASTASTWVNGHGPGGIFSQGAVRPDMYATIPRLNDDVSASLPLIASNKDNEIYEILTGITAPAGNRAADTCSEGPTPGRLKVGRVTAAWGTLKVDTEVNRLVDFGRRLDYQDMDRNVLNMQGSQSPFVPQVPTTDINTRLGKQFMELGLSVEQAVTWVDFIGVAGAGSNSAYLNMFIEQYQGFETWVRTGYTDALGGAAIPAADSIVIAHNAPIGSNGVNGVSFIENVVDAYYSVVQKANEIGMMGTEFEIWVHPKAWRAIAYQWACTYYTTRCSGEQYNEITRDGVAIAQARDEMLRNRVLMIDGEPVRVRLSQGIPALGIGDQTYMSDVYIMPRYWNGRPLVFRQYFPLNNAEAQTFLGMENDARVINNGLYAVGKRSTNGLCTKFEFVSRMRLILDTPFLAARVNDVSFTYRAQDLDSRVGESLYKNGGVSSRF